MTETHERREYTAHSYRGEHGRSRCDIDCPFCGHTVTAYVWSLAGSGKKCNCGAIHGSYNSSHRKT